MNRWTPIRPVLRSIEKLVDRVVCVLGAVASSQIPEFIQQYLQRLGGHLDEARLQLSLLQPEAARAGVSLGALAARVDSLASAESAIRGASAWGRPFAFLLHCDPGIARSTLAVFRPAVPTTAEGAAYAAAGVVLAFLAYRAAVAALTSAFRRLRKTPAANR